eukprot:405262-Amphidinium_carterae.1
MSLRSTSRINGHTIRSTTLSSNAAEGGCPYEKSNSYVMKPYRIEAQTKGYKLVQNVFRFVRKSKWFTTAKTN